MTPVRILGIGSPFGDDQAGWRVIEALERSKLLNEFVGGEVSTHSCDRPGSRLLESLRGAAFAIVIDAVQAGSAPGTVHRLDAWGIADDPRLLSSHGFGLASALALGEALGELPDEVIVYGIEIGEIAAAQPFEPLTEPVAGAVDELTAIIAAELTRRLESGS